MSQRTLLAAELARRIPEMAKDNRQNNEQLVKGLLEQYLGPEFDRQDLPGQPVQIIHINTKTK
jgi:hypothetical protein